MITFLALVVVPLLAGLCTGGLIGFVSFIDGADDPEYCAQLMYELMFIIVGFVIIMVMAFNDSIWAALHGRLGVTDFFSALVVLGFTVRFYFRRDIGYSQGQRHHR